MPGVLTEHHETRGEEGHLHHRPIYRDRATPPTASHRAQSSKLPGMGTVGTFSYGLLSTQRLTVPVWDSPDSLS